MLARRRLGTYQENKLTRNPSENARPHSSQLAEPLWTDPWLWIVIGVRALRADLHFKEEGKKTQAGNYFPSFLQKSSHTRENLPTTVTNVSPSD